MEQNQKIVDATQNNSKKRDCFESSTGLAGSEGKNV
jgi:hypothetical protein